MIGAKAKQASSTAKRYNRKFMKKKPFRDFKESKPALWKRLVIIILIVAMPLFFWFVRTNQMQQAAIMSEPELTTKPVLEQHK